MGHNNSISEELKVAIVNYLSGNWNECKSDILNSWLDESSDHRILFQELVDLWEISHTREREKNFDIDQAWRRLESKLEKGNIPFSNRRKFRQVFSYAAVFVLAFICGALGYFLVQRYEGPMISSERVVEYNAPYGSKTSLKLLDGSFVWLNAGTTLKYNQEFGTRNRNVELSGEAYFEVARNKKLPFVVRAKQVSVTALGTKFNVKVYPEETKIETILEEGSVKLHDLGNGRSKDVFLQPGQKAYFNPENSNFSIFQITDNSEVSWHTSKWIIKDTRLEEFSKLLERRYNISIRFRNSQIKNYTFGGTITDETIEQILTAITYTAPIKYTIINNHVTLSIDEEKADRYKPLLK